MKMSSENGVLSSTVSRPSEIITFITRAAQAATQTGHMQRCAGHAPLPLRVLQLVIRLSCAVFFLLPRHAALLKKSKTKNIRYIDSFRSHTPLTSPFSDNSSPSSCRSAQSWVAPLLSGFPLDPAGSECSCCYSSRNSIARLISFAAFFVETPAIPFSLACGFSMDI